MKAVLCQQSRGYVCIKCKANSRCCLSLASRLCRYWGITQPANENRIWRWDMELTIIWPKFCFHEKREHWCRGKHLRQLPEMLTGLSKNEKTMKLVKSELSTFKMTKKTEFGKKNPKVFTRPFSTYPYIYLSNYIFLHTWLFLSCNSWKGMPLFSKMGVSL